MIIIKPIKKDTTIYNLKPNYNYGGDQRILLQSSQKYINNEYTQSIKRILFDLYDSQSYLENQLLNYQVAQLVLNIDYVSSSALKNISTTLYYFDENQDLSWIQGTYNGYPYNGKDQVCNWEYSNYNIEWNTPGCGIKSDSIDSDTYYILNQPKQLIYTILSQPNLLGQSSSCILKIEDQTYDYGSICLYSKQTNTIFQPIIRLCCDDYKYTTNTGSYEIIEKPFNIFIKNFKKTYFKNKVNKFELLILPEQQYNVLGTSSYSEKNYVINYVQNQKLLYRICDFYNYNQDQYQIIPYDESYTRVSFDTQSGMYFNLSMSSFKKNRNYKLQFCYNKDDDYKIIKTDYIFNILDQSELNIF